MTRREGFVKGKGEHVIGALIWFDKSGRAKAVYIMANSDSDQAIAEWGLSRITRSSCWYWLKRLFTMKKPASWQAARAANVRHQANEEYS